MLKSTLLHPELLRVLGSAGHGSKDGRLWNHRRRIDFASFTE